MKKLLAIMLSLVMVVSVVALVACQMPNNKNNNSIFNVSSAKDFYAYGAVSVATIIDVATTDNKLSVATSDYQESSDGVKQLATADNGFQNGNGTNGQLTDEQLAKVNEYLALVESIMGDGTISSSTQESDRTEYQYRQTVSFKDMSGATISYTLYYNEVELTPNKDARDNDRWDDDDDDRWDNDKDNETTYRIEGVLLIDEQEYKVEGYSESENEHNESESSMYFTAFTGENSYIKMQSEWSTEEEYKGTETENEISYSIYQAGKLVQRTTLEHESQSDETELKMTVTKDGVTNVLYFEDELENNVRKINVRANIDGDSVNFKVWITTNDQGEEVYRYQFKDGYKDCPRDFWDD